MGDAPPKHKVRKARKRKKNFQKANTTQTVLVMAAIQMMLFGGTIAFNEDQCNYGTGSDFINVKGTSDCIVFTNGIEVEKNGNVFADAISMTKCSTDIEYAY